MRVNIVQSKNMDDKRLDKIEANHFESEKEWERREWEKRSKVNRKHSKYLYVYHGNLENISTWTKIHLEHRIVWNLWQSVYEKLHRFIVIFHIFVSMFFPFSLSFSLSMSFSWFFLILFTRFYFFTNVFALQKHFHAKRFPLSEVRFNSILYLLKVVVWSWFVALKKITIRVFVTSWARYISTFTRKKQHERKKTHKNEREKKNTERQSEELQQI